METMTAGTQEASKEAEVPKEIAEAAAAEKALKSEKETEARTEAKVEPKAETKKETPKKTAKKGGKQVAKGQKLESLKDFVKGIRGSRPSKKAGAKVGQTRTMDADAKKSTALKALLRAMTTRGWKPSKGGVYTLASHKVSTETDGHYVVVDKKYQLALGKGAILELDSYMG